MKQLSVGTVGSKGELFPPKKIREQVGIKPASRVAYYVEDARLVVEPIPSLEDLMSKPPVVEVTLAEFKKFRRELSRKAES